MKEELNWNISPPPMKELEIRCIIFDATDVELMDIEGTSDVFFKVSVGDGPKFETDTHYRCMDGNCSFNYRLLIPYKDTKDASKTLTI